MAMARRPNRHNPNASRLTFVAETERCLKCRQPLSSAGSAAHCAKTVQTLQGEFYVVAYSRVCVTAGCACLGQHYRASGHLKISLPYSTYGLDVVKQVGIQRDRYQRQFIEIMAGLNEQGVAISDKSVGRVYRQFLALVSGAWPQREARLQAAVEQYGGLILQSDALAPDGDGPQFYVLWEALSGTPISGLLLDKADELHVTKWMQASNTLLLNLPVLATMCDGEGAVLSGLQAVWKDAANGLCQTHYLGNLAAPVEEDDRMLRQELQTQLAQLPGIPNLTPEQADEQTKAVPAMSETTPAETVSSHNCIPTPSPAEKNASQFANLLFPNSLSATDRDSDPLLGVMQLERYYGYYRRAVRDALTRTSRKPLQYGGLQGYDQLVGINQALLQRQAQWGVDAYLDGLQRRVQTAITATQTQAEAIRQAKNCLVRMERCLAHTPLPSFNAQPVPTPGSQTVAKNLNQILDDLACQPELSSTSQRLIEKWQQMNKKWLPGILHCYDVPGLPRHNLDLEALFGRLRRNQRRISGRKETSPLRVFGPGELMFAILKEEDTLACLQRVSEETYWSERRKQEEREEPRRWLRRLRQDPLRAFVQVNQQFYAVANERARASP